MCNSVPYDSDFFLGIGLLFQKEFGGLRPLNLERRIPLESFRQP